MKFSVSGPGSLGFEAAQQAFDKLKLGATYSSVLAHPKHTIHFEVVTDASSCGISAVLNKNGHPIAYKSRTFSSVERNYSMTERECLAVVWVLQKFRI